MDGIRSGVAFSKAVELACRVAEEDGAVLARAGECGSVRGEGQGINHRVVVRLVVLVQQHRSAPKPGRTSRPIPAEADSATVKFYPARARVSTMEIEWKDTDPASGERRFVRAEKFARVWQFKVRFKRRTNWQRTDDVTREMWETLLDALE